MEMVLKSEEIGTTWRRIWRTRNQKAWKPSEISARGGKCFIVFMIADEGNALWGSNVGIFRSVARSVPTLRSLQMGEMDAMFHDPIL